MQRKQGFTLLELSIVIVIIGIIAAGVTVGNSMVRQAKLRDIIAGVDRYTQAIQAFRDKYQALPGDMSGATAIWGAANADANTCKTTASTGTETCNGDGNGSITTYGTATTYYETFRAWQHLANAGLIEGKYNGISASGSLTTANGTNVPIAADKSGFLLHSLTYGQSIADASMQAAYFPANYGVVLRNALTSTDIPASTAHLAPGDAQSIDRKIDDGQPCGPRGSICTGKVLPFRNGATAGCLTNDDPGTAAYDLGTTNPTCVLNFITGL